MRIDGYRFGEIVIDGRTHDKDVLLYGDQVIDWWRVHRHRLQLVDVEGLLEQDPPPEVLIVGTGNSGLVDVPDKVVKDIQDRGIEVRVHRTQEACHVYNQLADSKRTAAALHLTC
ncbi:MAG: MTH938/NDUFAF3 family protein [Candidatus Bipolaricaulota bacterium]